MGSKGGGGLGNQPLYPLPESGKRLAESGIATDDDTGRCGDQFLNLQIVVCLTFSDSTISITSI